MNRALQKGFTIVEIITVIVVLGILTTLVTISYATITDRAEAKDIEKELIELNSKLTVYKSDQGRYPASLSAVVTNASAYTYNAGTTGYCASKATENGSTTYSISSKDQSVKKASCTPDVLGYTPESCFQISGNVIITYRTNLATCTSDVVIPPTIGGIEVTTLDDDLFHGLSKTITSVVLPNTLTTIRSFAFTGNQLTHVDIPASVTEIQPYAFSENAITSLKLRNGLLSIRSYAFDKNNISRVSIPESVTSIEGSAFANNAGIVCQTARASIGTTAHGCASRISY